MKSKYEIQRRCEYCNKLFMAQKMTTRYCSHKCNSKAYKESKRHFTMTAIKYSTLQKVEEQISLYEKVKDKEYLSVAETAILMGVGRATVYRYLHNSDLRAVQIQGKTFIRKADLDNMFDNPGPYKAKPNKDRKPITEFYTSAEIQEKFNIKEAWLYRIVRENKIPKTLIQGKSYFSKKHIDKYFDKKGFNELQTIKEWYTIEEIQEKYNLTLTTIYSFVSENAIPRKKDGRKALYSKRHFDIAKGYDTPEYYTTEEAMQKYNLTRDGLYHYVKYHNIPKIKEGRCIKISKPDLDKLFEKIIIL